MYTYIYIYTGIQTICYMTYVHTYVCIYIYIYTHTRIALLGVRSEVWRLESENKELKAPSCFNSDSGEQ